MSNVSDRYAPFIQEYIYERGWESIRKIQVAACDVILGTNDNVLLAYGTASGKTEAAFLPMITDIYENPCKSVGILYISPLKTLINDQFLRIEEIKSTNISKNDLNVYDEAQKLAKYNYFIPKELLKKQYLQDCVDIENMQEDL